MTGACVLGYRKAGGSGGKDWARGAGREAAGKTRGSMAARLEAIYLARDQQGGGSGVLSPRSTSLTASHHRSQ